ncbi:MAG: hypothetical protein LBB15_00800 [Puniceicoccales bacterium]|nr:hypothetical protein [Puniceicoccales bacterium]
MGANFTAKILVWCILTAILGIFILRFYRNNISAKSEIGKKDSNKLGKAMINMERACAFGDFVNFYEFTKYAIREAMRLPQGSIGFTLALEDVKKNLRQKTSSKALEEVISEIYTLAAQAEKNEDLDVDLKTKLETYYEAIRELNDIYGKQT